MAGKQQRAAFKALHSPRKANVLNLMHTDIFSTNATSLGGSRYHITFIDDHSKKIWAYALKSKDEDLEKFKHFHSPFERNWHEVEVYPLR